MDDVLARSGAGMRYRDVTGLRHAILRTLEEWRSGQTATVSEDAVAPFELAQFGTRYARILEDSLCES
jgi:hypothetical protein